MSEQEAYQSLVGALENAQKVALVLTRKQRDELRAILAPLLERPIVWEGQPVANVCVFCHAESEDREPTHASSCPVLRRAALLGRE